MRSFDWLAEYSAALKEREITFNSEQLRELAPAKLLEIDSADWAIAAEVARNMDLRWAGIWGDEQGEEVVLSAIVVNDGDHLVLRTRIDSAQAEIASHTPIYPGANRLERHLADMLGVRFIDHPDPRRWTRHQAWADGRHPLRGDFPADLQPKGRTPADSSYPFASIQGTGVYEIPVGPVHAGIIEPGHFRFQAAGEPILRMEERLGYVHKGIEKIAVGRDADSLARLAGRVSGDSCVAHAWAACQAMEHACRVDPPQRAMLLRGLLCERERVANHLGDIGAICNDVGFAFAMMQCSTLREQWLRQNHTLFGHRLLMDRIVPGGVVVNVDVSTLAMLRDTHQQLHDAALPLFDILTDHPSLDDRLLETGWLSPESAHELGVSGYVGKASGEADDLRKQGWNQPYSQLSFTPVSYSDGDAAARMKVRMDEVLDSLDLMDQLVALLEKNTEKELATSLSVLQPCDGLGLIEGWRGDIITYVRLDEAGRVARYFSRDPSWFSWPALERIVLGNIVPDFPVCNKSVNGSYSGHDL